jgi:hypothetical protein
VAAAHPSGADRGAGEAAASKLLRRLGHDSVDVSVVSEMLGQGMSEDEVGAIGCDGRI